MSIIMKDKGGWHATPIIFRRLTSKSSFTKFLTNTTFYGRIVLSKGGSHYEYYGL